jgi:hypothetical protein
MCARQRYEYLFFTAPGAELGLELTLVPVTVLVPDCQVLVFPTSRCASPGASPAASHPFLIVDQD